MFVLYSKVGHKRREWDHFLILESWLALKYNFHLGADTDISDTSTSIASCYSLNSCKGCCKPPEVAATKLKKATTQIHYRASRSSSFARIFISPFQFLAPVLQSYSQDNLEGRKGRLGKAGMLGPLTFNKYEGKVSLSDWGPAVNWIAHTFCFSTFLTQTLVIHYILGTWTTTVTTVSGPGRWTCQSSAKAIPSPDQAVTAFPKAQIWENRSQAPRATYRQNLCSPQHSSQQPLGFAALGRHCRLVALQLTVSLEQLTSMVSKPVKMEQTTLSPKGGNAHCHPPCACPRVLKGFFSLGEAARTCLFDMVLVPYL